VTHDEIAELLGAYALDAVSPDEATEIEQHLAECPRCRAEVAAHREVAGVLGNLGGTVPAGLWGRIADELALGSEGPLPSGRATALLGRSIFSDLSQSGSDFEDPSEMAGSQSATHGPAPVISIDSARPLGSIRADTAGSLESARRRRRTVVLSSVVALAAALALVVGILSSKVVNLDSRVSALTTAVLTGGVKGQVAAAELDPSHVTVNLSSASASWSAKVVVLPGGQAFLVPGKMPTIAADKTFQAWAVVGGKYVSLGVLGRAPGDVALQLEPGMASVLVNAEPQGGSAQPTTPAVVAAPLPSTL
jgi:hypothetical protein